MATTTVANHSKEKQSGNFTVRQSGISKPRRTKVKAFDQATKDFFKKSNLKPSTHAQYTSICERHLLPYFGNVELNKLNHKLVNNFIQYKLKNGSINRKPLSPQDCKRHTNPIHPDSKTPSQTKL